jgi:hypothetical protein
LGKTIALRFEIVRFLKKPALYALKTLNFKLTLPSLAENPFPVLSFVAVFSPFLNKCQLLMLKDFWNLPVNPVWRVPGFMKGGEGR